MITIATAATKPPIHAAEFELDGFMCLRFFDPSTGELRVSGPRESKKARDRYIRKYGGLCRDQSVKEFLASIRPEVDPNVKLHAYLHLMEEHEDDVANGMVVSEELFLKVLDTWEFVFAIEPVTVS
jgi:hypothetical protein